MNLDEFYKTLLLYSVAYFPKFFWGLIIIYIFYLLSNLSRNIMLRVCQNRELDRDVVAFFAGLAKAVVFIIGIVTGLGTMGVDVSALVASLGLTGFVVGFALKDLFSNVIAGVMILVYRPFKRGDFIVVGGFSGAVRDIDLRYTTLEHEGQTILLPNSIIFSQGLRITHT
ncbi:MAG: mechanosensitive ion channel [Candidatus Omnitrophica bacterium]|nr:mechanosensitive ion channel [Candidatus Omnitrophota bacterium]